MERIAFARKIHGLQRTCGDQLIYMDQTTFQIWPKPIRTWQLASAPITAPENYNFLSAVTLFGAIGNCIQGGKLYMLANATDIPSTKKFLVQLAGALKDPYTRVKPYLVMDNHGAHRSDKILEELSRFHACFQVPYSSPFNCQETVWS